MKKTFYIAGVQFRPKNDIATALTLLKAGDHLGLVPEPTNKFDPYAVQVIWKGIVDERPPIHLGYVPKKISAEITNLIKLGADPYVEIEAVNPDGPLWEALQVSMETEDEQS